MVADYVRRAKYPVTTVQEVGEDMHRGMTFTDPDGFLVLARNYDELHVVHCYVRPGKPGLFKRFITITEEAARYFNCRAVLFTTMRPKGMGNVLGPHGYRPLPAVIFVKEVNYGQEADDDSQK